MDAQEARELSINSINQMDIKQIDDLIEMACKECRTSVTIGKMNGALKKYYEDKGFKINSYDFPSPILKTFYEISW